MIVALALGVTQPRWLTLELAKARERKAPSHGQAESDQYDTGGPPMQPEVTEDKGYKPAIWERILAALCAVAALLVVFFLVLRKEPFSDPNQVVLVRTILSLAVGIIGAVVPGFLQVNLGGKGVAIRAGGALALFVITYFFSPNVLPLAANKAQLGKIEKSSEDTRSDVGRIITRFNSVFIQAVYELPQNEPSVKSLEECITEIGRAIQANHKPLPQGLQLSYSVPAGKPPGPEVVSVEIDHLLDEGFLKLSPRLFELVPLITFLRQPELQVGINRLARKPAALVNSFLNGVDPPDLHLFVHDWPVYPQKGNFGKVIVDSQRKKVLVAWNGFEYPPDKWATSRKVVSIQDLDQSQFVVMLSSVTVDPVIEKVASQSVPVWVNVRFDNNFVTFVNLQGVEPVLEWKAFTATFPSAQDILDGKASHPLDPSYSWGF